MSLYTSLRSVVSCQVPRAEQQGDHQIPYHWVAIEQDKPGFADGIEGATATLLIREHLKAA